MILGSLFALVLASTALPSYVSAQQIIFDSAHNATTIIGTWSSGSKNVLTGSVSVVFRILCGYVTAWKAPVGRS